MIARLRSGINVIRASIRNAKIRNGAVPRKTSETETLPIALSVNKFNPIGGVTAAISILIIIMMAKWIGSIPSIFISGKKIGKVINSADITSRNIPKKSNKIFTDIKKRITLSLCSDSQFTSVCGIPLSVMAYPNTAAPASTSRIAADVTQPRVTTFRKFLKPCRLYSGAVITSA